MRGEKSEFLRDSTVDFWKWQDRVQTNAGHKECNCKMAELVTARIRVLRRSVYAARRFNVNLRNELVNWHGLFPVA